MSVLLADWLKEFICNKSTFIDIDDSNNLFYSKYFINHCKKVVSLCDKIDDIPENLIIIDQINLENSLFQNVDLVRIGPNKKDPVATLKYIEKMLINNEYPTILIECNISEIKELGFSMGYNFCQIRNCENHYLLCDNKFRHTLKISSLELFENNINTVSEDKLFCLYHYFKNISKLHALTCCIIGNDIYNNLFFAEQLIHLAINSDDNNIFNLGMECCDKLMFSDYYIDKNELLNVQSRYSRPLKMKNIIPINNEFSLKFKNSSPSILKIEDGYLVNLRSVNYMINEHGNYIPLDDDKIVKTDNYLLKLDENFNQVRCTKFVEQTVTQKYQSHVTGMEDIRLIDGETFFCNNSESNEKRIPLIYYGKFNSENGIISEFINLNVGEVKCEKNWLPFYKNGELYFVYKIFPLTIYKYEKPITKIPTNNIFPNAGFRGSGGMIPYKGGYLGTIHQVYYPPKTPRKYLHRFIWMNYDFTIGKFSKPFFFDSIGVEYTLSLCHSSKGLLIPYSNMDNTAKIGIVDYSVVDDMLNLN